MRKRLTKTAAHNIAVYLCHGPAGAHSCLPELGGRGGRTPKKGEPDRDTKFAIFRETSGKFGDFANHFWSPILHRSAAPFFLDLTTFGLSKIRNEWLMFGVILCA